MKFSFICGPQRAEFTRKPEKAIYCWQDGFETGKHLSDRGLWREALPHLGCAFEASEILLTTKVIESEEAYEIFVASAALLIDAFEKLSAPESCHHIYQLTARRLSCDLFIRPEEQARLGKLMENLGGQISKITSTAVESVVDTVAEPDQFSALMY